MNWSIFFGVLLVLFGASLIVKVVFNVDIPVARIIIALFLIYLGIRIFVGKDLRIRSHKENEYVTFFSQRKITDIENGREYTVVFGKAVMDLSEIIPADSQQISVKLNTIFGNSDILYNDTVPIKIKATTAFGGTKLPDGTTESFGTYEYNSGSTDHQAVLSIETNTVFGGTVFRKQ